MYKKIMLLLFVWCCHSASAQFNDSTSYYLSYAPTGVINKTNEGNAYVLTNLLKFNISNQKIALNSTSNWMYGQQNNRLVNNDFSSTLDFNVYKSLHRFYYWGLANYDKSYSLKIHNRLQMGAGGAYRFVDLKDAQLSLSDGIIYEFSALYRQSVPSSEGNNYQTFRNSLRLKFRWTIREIFILDGTNLIQHSLSSKQDYIIKLNNTLSVKLRKWLSFNTSFNYNKLNRTGKENVLLAYGILMETYF